MRPFHVVFELTTGQAESFAVVAVDPTQKKDGGCVGTVLSVHHTREAAERAASSTPQSPESGEGGNGR
jgi:hypothetical protein